MSQRMIDQIFREGYVMEVRPGTLRHYRVGEPMAEGAVLPFTHAQPFIVDNVTAYMYAGTSQNVWFSTDFPNCAPPAPVFWMETRQPPAIRTETAVLPWPGQYAWGALFQSVDVTQRPDVLAVAARAFHGAAQDRFAEARWAYQCFPFVLLDRAAPVFGPVMVGMCLVDAHGALLPHWIPAACGQSVCTCPRTHRTHSAVEAWWTVHLDAWPSAHLRERREVCRPLLFPFWLALSFLHCKNVTATPTDPCHPRGKRRPQDPCRRVHYKVLDIHPMQRLLQRERTAHQGDLRQALHIMRGHFKNYQDGSGLFGKHHGLYWWDQRLRGSSDHGIVVKDYAVQPPASLVPS